VYYLTITATQQEGDKPIVSIEFDNNMPIYLQIMNYIKRQIVTGRLKAGDKILSVRELAAELQINPNTIQRTFQELEREEIVETRRGLGRYVTSEESKIMAIKKEMAGELLVRFISGMQELGFADVDIVSIVAEAVSEGPNADSDQERGANLSE
jgi:GntR family transcriptional regulator